MSANVEYQLAHENQTRVPALIASGAICLSAAYASVILRFTSRRLSRTAIKADDWAIVLGLVFTTIFTVIIFTLIWFGLGRHAVLIKDPVRFTKIVVANEAIYNPAVVAIKSSILLLYRRIFPSKRFNVILWCVGAFVLSYSLAQSAAEVFQCSPIDSLWNPKVIGKCIDLDDVLIACSSLNIATDILILLLPLPALLKLHISTERKVQLIGIFMLGGFVCIVSIIRAPKVRDVSLTDPTWSDDNGIIWSMVELNVGIVSACLPTLRPLVNFLLRGHSDSSHASSSKKPGDGSGIKLNGLNKSWPGAAYSDPENSNDKQPFVRLEWPDAQNEWDPYTTPAAAHITADKAARPATLSGRNSANTITVTTDLHVRHISSRDGE